MKEGLIMFQQSCGCQNMNSCSCQGQQMNFGSVNGCPRPQPLVAPRRVCVTNQITPVAQPVICPIECRRVNHCMYYPVFYPVYEQTFVNAPNMNSMNSPFSCR